MCQYEAQLFVYLQVDWCKISSCGWSYVIVSSSSCWMIDGVRAAAVQRDAYRAASCSRLRVTSAKERRVLARRAVVVLVDLFSASSCAHDDVLTRMPARPRDARRQRAVSRGNSHVRRSDVPTRPVVVVAGRPEPRFATTRAVVGGVRAGGVVQPRRRVADAPCTVTTEAADLSVVGRDAVVADARRGLVTKPQRRHAGY